MNPTRRFALVLLVAWLTLGALAGGAFAQNRGAEVRAYLSSGVVRQGDRVALIVTIENARTCELGALPRVDGLGIGPAPLPSEHRSFVIVGSRSQESVSRTWQIPLRPADIGVYKIPPFDVTVDGAPRRTPELVLNVVRDMKGEELGFLEIKPASNKVVVGQPFSLEILFGFDTSITDSTNYANLALAWWGNLPGLLENEPPRPDPARRRLKILVNDRETIEVEQLDNRKQRGREFVQLRVVRSFTPTRTGQLEFPISYFEFGRIVESNDFFRTRREKGETFFSRAADLAIDVVPLPEAGRPVDFSGAIGALVAKADAAPRDVDAGESIKFKVEWTGAGNLEFFTAPDPARLEAFRNFRVYGKTEDRSLERRVVTYDIAPITSEVREIPALVLSVYDPLAERYTSVSTEPIAIRVRALEGATGLAEADAAERFRNDILDVEREPGTLRSAGSLGAAWIVGLLAVLPAGWLALRTAVRRRGDPNAPAVRTRRNARRKLARGLESAKDARAQLELVLQFLGERSGRTPEAWIGERVTARIGNAGEALDASIAELERSVWGGSRTSLKAEQLLAAADAAIGGGL